MKNKTLRMLAIIGALFAARPAAKAAEPEQDNALHTRVDFGLYLNEELANKNSFTDISLCPHLRLEKGLYAVDYDGCFWKQWFFDGTEGDWLNLKHKLTLENKDYAVVFGRDLTAGQMAGYQNVPMTTGFSNTIKGHGVSHSLTGVGLWDKQRGFQVGWYAKDGEFGLKHLDMGVIGYRKQLDDQWGVQFQAGAGRKALDYAAATVAYTPDKNNAIVAEGVYKNDRVSAVLMAKHNMTDRLALFANAEVTQAKGEKVGALVEAGVAYDFAKGFRAVAAVQQEIGGEHQTRGVIGLQYSGNFGFAH